MLTCITWFGTFYDFHKLCRWLVRVNCPNPAYIVYYYSSGKKLSLLLTWYYRNIILQRINSVVVLCTRIVLLVESLLCWWGELRTMLRHLNRRGLNGITWALLTVYNLQCIIPFSLTLMMSSVKTMASSRFGNSIFVTVHCYCWNSL